jgi:hypothetical protein
MTPSEADRQREIHQHDLLAWTVSFVVTLGLHVGVVLFILLTIALFAYALAATLGGVPSGIQAITWFATVVSLIIWSVLVKQQARTFRPHVIRGIGRAIIATSGCGRGEIAADTLAALIGLAEIIPGTLSLSSGVFSLSCSRSRRSLWVLYFW